MMVSIQNKVIFPEILSEQPRDAHKKQCGQVLVVAGSRGMTGAAILTCRAVLRAGAGIVTLAFPEILKSIYRDLLPEVMTVPCPTTEDGGLSVKSLPIILEKSTDFDVVAVGPGLSRDRETQKLVKELVIELDKPLIFDADGLNAIAGQADKLLPQRKQETVITPHEGEMARLIGGDVRDNRIEVAQKYAQKWLANVVLKGPETIIAGVDGEAIVNKSGNQALATAGTGDVLTGMIAALWSQNLQQPFESAATAVYLHGLAGELASKKLGKRSVIASDVIDNMPEALKKLVGS